MSTNNTRIAPSPTGNLHLGTVRTALYNLLFSKKHSGKFFFRLEDTDRERSSKEFEEEIILGFNWLAIKWDKPDTEVQGLEDSGIVRQSLRQEKHTAIIEDLLSKKIAYKCFATPEELDQMRKEQRAAKKAEGYDNRSRNLSDEEIKKYETENSKYVIRLNIGDNRDIKWDDLIRGQMSVNTRDLGGDPVIQKHNGQVLYNFAVVVDDHDMEISHVFRGEDHLTNTAKQIAISEAAGLKHGSFGHLPLIFTKDKQKLSKRKHGDIAGVEKYKNEGYLPEALVNYLIATSYTNQEDAKKEIYTLEEVAKTFDLKAVSKSPAIYDIQKLNWFNREYISKLSFTELMDYLKPYISFDLSAKYDEKQIESMIEAVRGNLDKFSDIDAEINYFFERIEAPEKLAKFLDEGKDLLEKFIANLDADKYDFNDAENLKNGINTLGEELGLSGKKLFFPFRVALSSRAGGPDLGLIMNLLGKEEVLERLKQPKLAP